MICHYFAHLKWYASFIVDSCLSMFVKMRLNLICNAYQSIFLLLEHSDTPCQLEKKVKEDSCCCTQEEQSMNNPAPDIQFVTKFTRIKCQNYFFLPVNYDKLCFPTKQRKLYFQKINIHTQGYITRNKYIIAIDIILFYCLWSLLFYCLCFLLPFRPQTSLKGEMGTDNTHHTDGHHYI